MPKKSDTEIQKRFEDFLRVLRSRVLRASPENPTVRCWTFNNLRSEIASVIRANPFLAGLGTAAEMIERLQRIGWIKVIPVENSGAASRAFFLVDMEAGDDAVVDPLELLQALRPRGVICYFSAVSYYELSTQQPTHHHIAWFPTKPARASNAQNVHVPGNRETAKWNALGVLEFTYQGVPCFTTKRDASLVPGVQLREVSPRNWLRITTLEQTLLDTLMQPVRAGGEAVIFEAWENALDRIDIDRMVEHLVAIGREDLDRRVGAILESFDYGHPNKLLVEHINRITRRMTDNPERYPTISLLPGFGFPSLNENWNVEVP